MTVIFSRIALAAAVLLSTPALAAAADRPAGTPTPAPTAAPADAPAAIAPTRYCVIDREVTGTRIPVKTCHTRKQWLDQGFDPLAR